jgi:hypothetical protein
VVADRKWYEPDDEVPKRVYAGVLQRRGNRRGRLLQAVYPKGALAFFDLLARWRDQGDLEGLIVT